MVPSLCFFDFLLNESQGFYVKVFLRKVETFFNVILSTEDLYFCMRIFREVENHCNPSTSDLIFVGINVYQYALVSIT